MKQSSIIESVIENITIDSELLEQVDNKISAARQERSEILSRLRGLNNDLEVLGKYLTDAQKETLSKRGINLERVSSGLNEVASAALELVKKSKDFKLTNKGLYDLYIKGLKQGEEKISYSAFNIKLRPLFNANTFYRTKSKDGGSSHEDMISLPKSEMPQAQGPKKENPKTASKQSKDEASSATSVSK